MDKTVHIENMNIDVQLVSWGYRMCKAGTKRYTSGPKKGKLGTCTKMIHLAEIHPGKGDWQPFIQLTPGIWTNHFDDCVDAVLFPKKYKEYIKKYRPEQKKPPGLFDSLIK